MSLAIDWLRNREGKNPMGHLDDVFRFAMSRLSDREEAEDIAIEVVSALPNPCYRKDLKAYMIGMARRKVIDRLRKRKSAALVSDYEEPVHSGFDLDRALLVSQVLSQLNEEHREILVLKYLTGLSSAEIGQVLHKRPEAVDSQLQRARESFARVWSGLTEETPIL